MSGEVQQSKTPSPSVETPGGGDTIHGMFLAQVSRTPEAVAVRFQGVELTYAELHRRSNQLAHHLQSLGVVPGGLVGLSVERSINAIVSLYAILKAGAAVVPLDPNYPQERLGYMMETAGARWVITQASFAPSFATLPGVGLVQLDRESERWMSQSTQDLPVLGTATSLLYVIFTSGSTGRPKGVAMPHGPLVNLVRWQIASSPHLPAGARTLQFTTLSFDVAYQEIFSTGCSGGVLVLMTEEQRYDSAALWRYLESEKVHRLFLPFVALQQLAEAACYARTPCNTLLEVITAGEQLQTTPQLRELFSTWTEARLHNHYGPSETHVATAYTLPKDVTSWPALPPIGTPVDQVTIRIVDEALKAVPAGTAGELFIGGGCLADGYINRPELTAERFVKDPTGLDPSGRFYRTGDLVRQLPDGNLEFLGRIDGQVKIRGHRVELGEVESALREHPAVRDCVVAAPGNGTDRRLVAYIIPKIGQTLSTAEVRNFLKRTLADYLIPSATVALEQFPLTPSGKVDRRALPEPPRVPDSSATAAGFTARSGGMEGLIQKVWSEILGISHLDPSENFFDLGGHSLLLPRVQRLLREQSGREASILDLLKFTTAAALARHLEAGSSVTGLAANAGPGSRKRARRSQSSESAGLQIAIVGMAGRFPGANTVHEFWRNLCEGVESVTTFSDEQLLAHLASPDLLKDPSFVRSRCVLQNVDQFDAGFFGINRRDAELTDPQHRLFLECAWETLESAGHDPTQAGGSVGIYAGSSLNTYFLGHVLPSRESVEEFLQSFQVDRYNLLVGNDKDYLATRVAYRLNLKGPAVTIQTACSTSLVAVTQACAGLIAGQCDLALAGGASISFPQERGYLYQEGAIASSDGHCRPFDAAASGTVFGAGVALVALKRLEDAIADGNTIYAVIRGAAINNDGADKVSFTAPSVNGQAEVILAAQEQAGISPDTIGYVEAHGTGTPLGDPIEVAALTQAFRTGTVRSQYCRLGSVKGNVGHLEAAAGVTGLIKAALALHHGVIPPTVHYRNPNPKCELESSPFLGVSELTPWPRGVIPRRAAVSSFGVGGTNAHVVLEEAPSTFDPKANSAAGSAPNESIPRPELLVLSAKSPAALDAASRRLAEALQTLDSTHSATLGQVAWTLKRGRRAFEHRRILAASSLEEAIRLLQTPDPKRVFTTSTAGQREPRLVFMFPGQGSQYVNMGKELYGAEPVFRQAVDRCCDLLTPLLGLDLRSLLYPASGQEEEAKLQLTETVHTQPALFVIEYALAQLWISRGIRPAALVGHSIGEFVAAVVAEVLTLEDCLLLVSTRASLMQKVPPGSMLTVRLPETEVLPYLIDGVTVAVVNSPKNCVLSGPSLLIEQVRAKLTEAGVACKTLFTSHAFHSAMMDSMIPTFVERARALSFKSPSIPVVSTLTGRWVPASGSGGATEADWTDPEYWARQLRGTVRFSEAIATLLQSENVVLLEVGPGQTLTTLAQQQPAKPSRPIILPSMPPIEQTGELTVFETTQGRLWGAGLVVDWASGQSEERKRLVDLPTYPYERQRYWIDKNNPTSAPSTGLNLAPSPEIPDGEFSSMEVEAQGAMGTASDALIEDVIRQQLRLMNQQLEAISVKSP